MTHAVEEKEGCTAVNYTFPPVVFAETNFSGQQLDHFLSEVDEITAHGPDLEAAVGNASEFERVQLYIDLEMVDAYHSIETRLRILERERGPEYVADLVRTVREKNAARGYYGDREVPHE